MISAVVIVLFLAVAGVMFLRNVRAKEDNPLFKPVIVAALGIAAGLLQPFTVERVDAGHIGIKVNLTGNERGVSDYTYKTGWVVYNSWAETLYEYPTFQQHIDYEEQTVITKGGFSTVIKPTFNYSLIPDAVGDMFQELRLSIKEIEQGWLRTAVIGAVMDVANRWEVDKIFNEREQFENAIVTECNKRVSKWFVISQLRTNIVPPASLQEAILNKTKAIQETQAKEQEALVAIANAEKMIQIAKGDSAKAVIEASGRAKAMIVEAEAEAEAIRIKQKEVTGTYNDYIRAQRWNGVYPTTVLGSGTNTLFNLGN
jgi:regulator of protease activity HflC (stomatin/prohibitin superfamily)